MPGLQFRSILLLSVGEIVFAQTGTAPQTGNVAGLRNVIHSVADLDKTVALYREGLGLELKSSAELPKPAPLNDSLSKLTNTHGAKFRAATLVIPGAGFDFELTEFTGIPRTRVVPGNQDPGAATLVLTVRDSAAALAAVIKAGGQALTSGGAPIGLNGNSHSAFVRDPDGFFLELFQPDQLPADAAKTGGTVVSGRFGTTVRSTEKTLAFFQQVFGFAPQPGAPFAANPTVAKLVAVPEHAQFRMSRAKIPGTDITWEFVEYKGVDRKPFEPRIPDPGAPAFSIRVKDIDAALESVKAQGGSVVTAGGQPVKLANSRNAFVRDPDGFLLELIQAQ